MTDGPEGRRVRLLLALTLGTGIVDAVGYLGLDRVFTGNMTGNVVILGMALTGADGLPVLGPALALAGFFTGALALGWLLQAAEPGWTQPVTWSLAGVATLVLVCGVSALLGDPEKQHGLALAITTTVAVAMGAQAGVARHLALAEINTVVVTSVITGLAGDLARGAGHWPKSLRRVGAIACILTGAAVGAATLRWDVSLGLLVAGTVVAGVTVVGGLLERRASSRGTRASGPA